MNIKTSAFLVLVVLVAACSTAQPPAGRNAAAQKELDEALAGRVAGTPVDCLPSYRTSDMRIIDDWTILFKDGGTLYLQTPRGGCPGLASHRNILVTRLRGTTQICRGDINHLVDPVSGIGGGACVFSEFVPYERRPG